MKTWRVIALLTGIPLVACSSAHSDWQRASASNTVAAYEGFLQKHPNTTEAAAARARLRTLEDAQAWARAQQTNTLAAQAKERTEREAAWAGATATDSPEALEAFLEKYPQGPEADQARVKLAQMTGYRVQFASYRSETLAEKTRDRLQDKYGDLLGSVVIVPEAGSNAHVVRSAPMGEVEANNTCAKLKKAHLSCEVVKDINS